MKRPEILELEELNFNAWPALRTVHYDGWLLRCTGGDSRRVNSVNPVSPGVIPLDAKIETAEAVYARWQRKAIFRLTPLADEGLEEALAQRGYVVEAPTFVQVAAAVPSAAPTEVRIFDRARDTWIAAALTIRGLDGEPAAVFAAQHRALGIEAGWALVTHQDAPVAVGVVAIERAWAGLHGIYVAQTARRRGLARCVSEALIGYAHAKGARRVWLQVEQANSAALPLYDRLGFRTVYAYRHRIRER